jgi:hypothetical protein
LENGQKLSAFRSFRNDEEWVISEEEARPPQAGAPNLRVNNRRTVLDLFVCNHQRSSEIRVPRVLECKLRWSGARNYLREFDLHFSNEIMRTQFGIPIIHVVHAKHERLADFKNVHNSEICDPLGIKIIPNNFSSRNFSPLTRTLRAGGWV